MIQLSDRDKYLLKVLSISTVITFELVALIYQTKKYHYKRIARLVEKDFLNKKDNYIFLGTNGAKYLGLNKKRIRYPEMMDLYSNIAELVVKMPNVEFLSNTDIRYMYNLNRKTYFRCGIKTASNIYLVYLVMDNTPIQVITKIQNELKSLGAGGHLRSAIIFTENLKTMQDIPIEQCNQDELLVLPKTMGMPLMNSYFTPEIQEYILSLMPGAFPTKVPYADFQSKDVYYVNLITNNFARRKILTNYFETRSKGKIKILCLDSQRKLYGHLFPNAEELIVIPEDRIINFDSYLF